MKEAIGVIGLGMVGGAVRRAFIQAGVTVRGYDSYLEIGRPHDLADCRVVFLCVPTPSLKTGGYDLTEVWSATREIEAHLEAGTIVAIKSTVPPGTSERLTEAFPRLVFASLPEFLVASRSDETFTKPDRVVVGAESETTASVLTKLMNLVAPEAPVIVMRPKEAEFTKLCSNALLSAKVAMANALAEICEGHDIAWPRVKSVVGLDRRIGPDHLTVTDEGGFGGECLPKDLDGLIAAAEAAGCNPTLLKEIAGFNRRLRGLEPEDGRSAPEVSVFRRDDNGHRAGVDTSWSSEAVSRS